MDDTDPPITAPVPEHVSPPFSRAPRLWVRTLGGFAVWRDGERVPDATWRRRKAGVLFKCLLSAPRRRLMRTEAIDLLWPVPDEAPAPGQTPREALRGSLHTVRQLLDGPTPPPGRSSVIVSEGDTLALVVRPDGQDAPLPPHEWLDAVAFRHAADVALRTGDAGSCREALALYTGDYLPDDTALDADWPRRRVTHRRQRLHGLYLRLLFRLADLQSAAGALHDAEEHLRAALRSDPYLEEAALRLMRVLDMTGRRGDALRVYDELATALDAGLGLTPAATLQALRARLLRDHTQASPANTSLVSTLPTPPTPFIGRAAEREDVRRALANGRILTLVGPGGCGKTRLALTAATESATRYADGVAYAELSALSSTDPVTPTILEALGLYSEPGQPPLATLLAFLRPRHLLLVLDNCEHVAAACALLVERLTGACPRLSILATSRRVLGLTGERVSRVPGLAVPDPTQPLSPTALTTYDAARLFMDRATARVPGLALTAETAGLVARICARLEGIALAIELAAARVGTLPLAEIAARLDADPRDVAVGSAAVTPRHRSLQATLDWSYDLLTPPAQALLRRLAVFRGGCPRDTVEEVCAWGAISPAALPDLLAALTEASLITLNERLTSARYCLLETVRQEAEDRLTAAGESGEMDARHSGWYVRLAETAGAALRGPEQGVWLERVATEQDNLRRIFERTAAPTGRDVRGGGARSADALRVVAALARFWEARVPLDEARRQVDGAIEGARQRDVPAYGPALVVAGRLALLAGDGPAAVRHFDCALAWAQERGEQSTAAGALLGRGAAALQAGDEEGAVAAVASGQMAADAARDPWAQADAIELRGRLAHQRGRFDGIARWVATAEETRAWYAEGVAVRRSLGDGAGLVRVLLLLGDAALDIEDYDGAVRHYEDALTHAQALGDRLNGAAAIFALGIVGFATGDYAPARRQFERCVEVNRRMGARARTAMAALYLADMRSRSGDLAGAYACCAESERIYQDLGDDLGLANMRSYYADLALYEGAIARAAAMADECITLVRACGDDRDIVFALYYRGVTARLTGDACAAVSCHRDGLALVGRYFRGWYRRHGVNTHLRGLGQALADRGAMEAAARLLGASAAIGAPIHRPLTAWEHDPYERTVAILHAALGDDGYRAAWAAGEAMDIEQAIAEGLACADRLSARDR